MKKYIFANWKLNKNIDEGIKWLADVGPKIEDSEDYEIILCPSFILLSELKKEIDAKKYHIKLGAQNVSSYSEGAYTGEVSAKQLKGLVDFALVGHSERRSLFAENNVDISKKVELCLNNAIEPIVLVRNIDDIIPDGVKMFGWEPVEAIGTGESIDPEKASVMIELLTANITRYGMYGGSVNALSIGGYFQYPNIHGVVVGGASLIADKFLELVHAIR